MLLARPPWSPLELFEQLLLSLLLCPLKLAAVLRQLLDDLHPLLLLRHHPSPIIHLSFAITSST